MFYHLKNEDNCFRHLLYYTFQYEKYYRKDLLMNDFSTSFDTTFFSHSKVQKINPPSSFCELMKEIFVKICKLLYHSTSGRFLPVPHYTDFDTRHYWQCNDNPVSFGKKPRPCAMQFNFVFISVLLSLSHLTSYQSQLSCVVVQIKVL